MSPARFQNDRRVNIFEYLDYTLFLREYYELRKKETRSFSYENFARKIGLQSKGAIHNIIQGKRGISNGLKFRLCEALGLNKDECEYFGLLVAFKQAKESKEANLIYAQIVAMQKRKTKNWEPQLLHKDQFEFYSKFYHSVIRSLIGLHGFKDDYQALARQVRPRITPKQARASVELLKKLDLVKEDENGNHHLTSTSITTENEVQSLAIRNFHMEMGKMAVETISEVPKETRNAQGATLGISTETYRRMCDEITQFRLKLQQMTEEDEAADRVYRLNLQLFPVSDTIAEKDSK